MLLLSVTSPHAYPLFLTSYLYVTKAFQSFTCALHSWFHLPPITSSTFACVSFLQHTSSQATIIYILSNLHLHSITSHLLHSINPALCQTAFKALSFFQLHPCNICILSTSCYQFQLHSFNLHLAQTGISLYSLPCGSLSLETGVPSPQAPDKEKQMQTFILWCTDKVCWGFIM